MIEPAHFPGCQRPDRLTLMFVCENCGKQTAYDEQDEDREDPLADDPINNRR